MFEHFTNTAIAVIMKAQEEARRLRHNFVGTEQLLLGLIKEEVPVFCLSAGGVWRQSQ
jgi:ATP-dependent Clp protease ATP-binding subunit ClpC